MQVRASLKKWRGLKDFAELANWMLYGQATPNTDLQVTRRVLEDGMDGCSLAY